MSRLYFHAAQIFDGPTRTRRINYLTLFDSVSVLNLSGHKNVENSVYFMIISARIISSCCPSSTDSCCPFRMLDIIQAIDLSLIHI